MLLLILLISQRSVFKCWNRTRPSTRWRSRTGTSGTRPKPFAWKKANYWQQISSRKIDSRGAILNDGWVAIWQEEKVLLTSKITIEQLARAVTMAQAVEDWTNYLKDPGSNPTGGWAYFNSLFSKNRSAQRQVTSYLILSFDLSGLL